MVQNFIEFVLLKNDIEKKFSVVEKRVSSLFDVQLKRSKEEDSLRCWVKLEGNQYDIARAKDYIIAVCSTCSPTFSLEEAILNENNNTSQFDRASTKEIPSALQLLCKQQQDLIGEESLQPKSNLRDPSGELISRLEEDVTPGRQECAYTANNKSAKQEQQVDGMVVKNEVNVIDEQKSNPGVASKEKVQEASDESLRDFALKLGYSESIINTGLSKLGPSADENSLLSELVKAKSSVKQLEEGSSTFSGHEKPHPVPDDWTCLRPIVIDGSNVAMSHGKQRVFSCRGIGIAVDWFLRRNHRNIKVFVPMWRSKASRPESPIIDQEVLKRLEEDGILVWTPSGEKENGQVINCYDDRYIIKHATENDGIIVSNDYFRDLMPENAEWKKVIDQRRLMYTFVDDKFMPPDDPKGRFGPTLDEYLKKGCGKLCPYERNCTYGNRCKYLHPERNPKKVEADSAPPSPENFPPEVPYGKVSGPSRPLPPCPSGVRQHPRPLPPAPREYHKPLPLPPQGEIPAHMARVFPPTLRTGQTVGIGERRSDPLPYCKELPCDVQLMQEQFERTLSDPCFQDQACGGVPRGPLARRGSVPQVPYVTQPFPSRPPELMIQGSVMVHGIPSDSCMVSGDWMLQQEQRMFGRQRFQQFPPNFQPNRPVHPAPIPQNTWGIPSYPHDQSH
ncbi:ribonuclease ZC3H12A-like [Montipora foliosa]|uniref:ribonuclease ZC3H12A-like n=1 Tax=Montipora foliosa TaxID=591990 RepID=UPI0035F11C58